MCPEEEYIHVCMVNEQGLGGRVCVCVCVCTCMQVLIQILSVRRS